MKIVQLPDPVLRKKAAPVTSLTPKIIALIKEMITLLKKQDDPPGVGLAAPQVGVSLQIFLIMPPSPITTTNPSPHRRGQGEVDIELFINPKIIKSKGVYQEKDKKNATWEGCLSLYSYYGPVDRANEITVEYETISLSNLGNLSNLELQTIQKTFTGFPAVIIQHEFDHLQGKLFIDRVLEQHQKLYKITKDSHNKEVLEEVQI